MSVKDVFKKSFLETDGLNRAISMDVIISMIFALTVSLIVGFFIYWVYKKFYLGVVFSRSFAISLIGMCVLTCTITLAISTNIVISLGMVGALSIIRYRTAIKEPIDLLYMFWAITAGIAIGAYMYLLIVLASIVMLILMIIVSRKQSNGSVNIMIVHYTGDTVRDEIQKALSNVKYRIKSQITRQNDTEISIEIHIKNDNPLLLEAVRNIPNVHDVTMLEYNGEYYG